MAKLTILLLFYSLFFPVSAKISGGSDFHVVVAILAEKQSQNVGFNYVVLCDDNRLGLMVSPLHWLPGGIRSCYRLFCLIFEYLKYVNKCF